MTHGPDLATPGAWQQTDSLLLLRQVMELGGELRHIVGERSNLSETEVRTLEHLSRQAVGPGEIARLLDVSTAAATGIVDRLESKGHAQRRAHPEDRRRQEVLITPHAREEVLRQMAPMFRALAIADSGLSEDERDVVVRYLQATLDAAAGVLGTVSAPEPAEASAPAVRPSERS